MWALHETTKYAKGDRFMKRTYTLWAISVLVLALCLCLLGVSVAAETEDTTEAVCSACGQALDADGLCGAWSEADGAWNVIVAYLASHGPLLLFVCIGLGYIVGKIKIKAFVLGATADSIRGKWEHVASPVFSENGGHAMFFRDFDGQDIMCLHAPEREGDERACFFPVSVTSEGVFIK